MSKNLKSKKQSKRCKHCLSKIPLEAKKCKACHEWQDTRKTEHQMYADQYLDEESFNAVYGILKKPFQYQIISFFKIPYLFSVIICVAIFFSLIQILWYVIVENNKYLLSFLAYALQMLVSWVSVIWIYKTIRKNQSFFLQISSLNIDIDDENKKQNGIDEFKKFNRKMFNNKKAITTGIFVGITSVLGDLFIGLPFGSVQASIVFSILAFTNMFFGGAVLYSMLRFGQYTHSISKKYSKNNFMTLEQKRATQQIGIIHLRSAILALVPLGFGIIAKAIGNWEINILVVSWYLIFFIVIIIYIFWPMENIHNLLKKDRDIQLIAIQMKIRKKLEEINENLSSTSLSKIKELRELERKTINERTWPFDTKGIWLVFIAIIFPLILIAINKYVII